MKQFWLHKLLNFFTRYTLPIPWKVGDFVIDDLTHEISKVTGISYEDGRTPSHGNMFKWHNSQGCVGVWLDNKHLDGGRFPWEISNPLTEEEIISWHPKLEKYRQELEARMERRFPKPPQN
jgi:hypothetical protein